MVTTGYELTEQDGADPDAALQVVRKAMTPAPRDALIGWLAELSVQVAYRAQTEFNGELTLQVYARNLAAYPADVAKDVLADWPNRSKWWPAWHDLKERLDAKIQRRRVLEREIIKRQRAEKKTERDYSFNPDVAKGLEDLLAGLAEKSQVTK